MSNITKFNDFLTEALEPNKTFLVYDLSGRSTKPYKLDLDHMNSTWDLNEEDDDEQILGDYLDICEIGDEWNTNSVKIICL